MSFETAISGPVAVIGDVHGQVDQLARVLEQLQRLPDFESRWIVFIGDMVDRGPDSKGAIDMMLDLMLHHPRTTVVAGNHELAMAAALGLVPTPEYSDWSGRWLDHYGCEATFASYDVDYGKLDELRGVLPQGHQDFLSNVPWCVEHPEYFFVHSGLDPHTTFQMQRQILLTRDFTLNRPQWLCSKSLTFEAPPHDCPHIVVSGHVQVPDVQFGKKRILCDTTGGNGGSLSCVLLPEHKVIQSNPHAKPVGSTPSPKKKGWFC